MFSFAGDTVLDPFSGTGTTTVTAIACGRHSVGYEIDVITLHSLDDAFQKRMASYFRVLLWIRSTHAKRASYSGFQFDGIGVNLVLLLVLLLERIKMAESIFDHERLDVYRLFIDYVAVSFQIARKLSGVNRHSRDQWLRAAQSIPLNIAEGNGKQSLKDKNRFFEIARGSALECAAIHDVLRVSDAIDDADGRGKADMKRIVSMLTRLIQQPLSDTQNVKEVAI